MVTHQFLLESGTWLGEGKVLIGPNEAEMRFYTKWKIKAAPKKGEIIAIQEVELADTNEKTTNTYTLTEVEGDRFAVHLHNELFGKVQGKGVIANESLAWEFHGKNLAFEGFEVCQKQPDGSYLTRAEYSSAGEPHTVITGKLWKKKEKAKEKTPSSAAE